MEEFQEADVLWPDHHHQHLRRDDGRRHQEQQQHGVNDASRGGGTSSAPVGIPVTRAPTSTSTEHEAASWATRISHGSTAPAAVAAAFVPPHELVAARARRCSEERAAFSVCVGNGRTLKGRDLRDVRTAVLRMTGFLET